MMYDSEYSLGTEELSKVVVIDAGPDKLLPGHPPVAVDVHPLEDVLGPFLRSLELVDEGLNPGPFTLLHIDAQKSVFYCKYFT